MICICAMSKICSGVFFLKPRRCALVPALLLLLLLPIWGARVGSNSYAAEPSSRDSTPTLHLEDVVDILGQAHSAECHPPLPILCSYCPTSFTPPNKQPLFFSLDSRPSLAFSSCNAPPDPPLQSSCIAVFSVFPLLFSSFS